jgi:hypothetical protein
MKKYHALFAAIAMSGLFATEASALKFDIAGTHDRDTIQSACHAAGGSYASGAGGYSCLYSSGASLNCDNKGKCTGHTATRTAGSNAGHVTLNGALSRLSEQPKKPPLDSGIRAGTSGVASAGSQSGGSQGVLATRSQLGARASLNGVAATQTGSAVSTNGSLAVGSVKATSSKLR